ncbi:12469_t:CDS:2, partial [Funneliformis caledonium]
HNLGVAGFNDIMKVTVLSGKMGGRDKYREVKIGTAQASMKALIYEKFNTIDTPKTYEKRIRPHVDGMPYAD